MSNLQPNEQDGNPQAPRIGGGYRSGVQLIAYADRFGGTITGLRDLLDGSFRGLFAGVHVLPFFTPFDGADAGFDPTDHAAVDRRLGTWEDVRELARHTRVMADLIVNHVSSASESFLDFIRHADASPYADLFLGMRGVYPDGATEDDLVSTYRPRPGLPFTPVTVGGERRLLWTTFTAEQIDIDVRSTSGRAYLSTVLRALTDGGVSLVRLDAVGYAVKTAGTSSFMTPDTFDFIRTLTSEARGLGAEVLVEVHAYYARQIAIAKEVDLVYDFALPPLILHALYTGDAQPLLRWLDVRPRNAVTVLDTHDGIGVIDVGPDQIDPSAAGLLTAEQLDALVEGIHQHSNGQSRAATGRAASNLDVYQVNSTYYDALGRDDRAYLIARAIQFFTPGIPQVYYVGLLAGRNDMDLLAQTGVGRDINRHRYTSAEIEHDLKRAVVANLEKMIRFRNTHPAFRGNAEISGTPSTIRIRWQDGPEFASLEVDLASRTAAIEATPHPQATLEWTNALH